MEIKYKTTDEKKSMMDDEGYLTICQIVHEALGRPLKGEQTTLEGEVASLEPVGIRSISLRDGTTVHFLEDAKWVK